MTMEPLLARFIVQAAPRASSNGSCRRAIPPFPVGTYSSLKNHTLSHWPPQQQEQQRRRFHVSPRHHPKERQRTFDTQSAPDSSYSQPASKLSQDVTSAEEDVFHSRLQKAHTEMQTRSPWTREGSDVPPVARQRSAGAMTKGKLLTTPSRMLKLILPLTTRDWNNDRKSVEPLALLVHPQQPLSYLERLVQSELPMLRDSESDKERAPHVVFRAEDSMEESITDRKDRDKGNDTEAEGSAADEEIELENAEEGIIDGKREKTGKIRSSKAEKSKEDVKRDQEIKKHPDNFPDDKDHPTFVRWSPSTEIGDFIRDAARGKEFAVDIEGAPEPIYVGVPSFADRTFYLRMRLRKTARQIAQLADIKKECDHVAHQGAKRIAQGGFLGLIGWWGVVYYLTFKTDLGWDVMEPVTYLVGLSGLIGGYMWFLYHNREVSYRSAMHVTVSRRQSQLYELKGFNLPQWEMLIEEGNRLRREIKLVAEEYDVDWDETDDEGSEAVREALRKERRKKNNGKQEEEEEEPKEADEERGEEGKKSGESKSKS